MPVTGSSAGVRHCDYLNTLVERPVHYGEREPTQQNASCVSEIGSPGFWLCGNVVYSPIELVAKACRSGFTAFSVPPLGGLGFVGGERVDFDGERRH